MNKYQTLPPQKYRNPLPRLEEQRPRGSIVWQNSKLYARKSEKKITRIGIYSTVKRNRKDSTRFLVVKKNLLKYGSRIGSVEFNALLLFSMFGHDRLIIVSGH